MAHAMPPTRLHFVLQRAHEEIFEPDSVAELPLVRFSAFAPAHRIFGWTRLHAERLTDLLNGHDELLLTDAEVETLDHHRQYASGAIRIATHELVAVHAAGPRGEESRRLRTRSHPVAIQSGRFLIAGHLHAEPGTDVLASLRHRPPMVPLTDAWIQYWSGGLPTSHGIGTIVVNREAADWIRLVREDDLLDGDLRPTTVVPEPATT
jgi:hypothetical protein